MNDDNYELASDCDSYNEAVRSIEEFLEEKGYNREDHIVEAIVDDCYESDGTIYTLVASEDEIYDSIETNSIF